MSRFQCRVSHSRVNRARPFAILFMMCPTHALLGKRVETETEGAITANTCQNEVSQWGGSAAWEKGVGAKGAQRPWPRQIVLSVKGWARCRTYANVTGRKGNEPEGRTPSLPAGKSHQCGCIFKGVLSLLWSQPHPPNTTPPVVGKYNIYTFRIYLNTFLHLPDPAVWHGPAAVMLWQHFISLSTPFPTPLMPGFHVSANQNETVNDLRLREPRVLDRCSFN